MARVFISYAHEDVAFRDALTTHLNGLRSAGLIERWHDGEICPGQDWKRRIDQELHAADIIIFLISANFLASESCKQLELEPALRRWRDNNVQLIPIIVRACDWAPSPIAQFQMLPTSAKPVATWTHPDDAWAEVTRGIRDAASRKTSAVATASGLSTPIGPTAPTPTSGVAPLHDPLPPSPAVPSASSTASRIGRDAQIVLEIDVCVEHHDRALSVMQEAGFAVCDDRRQGTESNEYCRITFADVRPGFGSPLHRSMRQRAHMQGARPLGPEDEVRDSSVFQMRFIEFLRQSELRLPLGFAPDVRIVRWDIPPSAASRTAEGGAPGTAQTQKKASCLGTTIFVLVLIAALFLYVYAIKR